MCNAKHLLSFRWWLRLFIAPGTGNLFKLQFTHSLATGWLGHDRYVAKLQVITAKKICKHLTAKTWRQHPCWYSYRDEKWSGQGTTTWSAESEYQQSLRSQDIIIHKQNMDDNNTRHQRFRRLQLQPASSSDVPFYVYHVTFSPFHNSDTVKRLKIWNLNRFQANRTALKFGFTFASYDFQLKANIQPFHRLETSTRHSNLNLERVKWWKHKQIRNHEN